ncbi:MAG: tRNA threonylcarbamoyladenosine biosynthesis protein TsaB [Alphaproteobacteria bacterium]|jgi:tRNA threonylcarbamoyladenosine biosynthesis protein TsaB
MNILAIDTATEACSVALLGDKSTEPTAQPDMPKAEHIDGIFDICPQQHSQQILPMVDTLLCRHGLVPSDLSAIAFGCGPGSFTGVRIAASTVQGLAFGANLPVVQVSTLATMAQQVYSQTGCEEQLVLIDARMKEVYMGHFKAVDGLATAQIKEVVVRPEDALNYLRALPNNVGLAGTGFVTYADLYHEALQAFTLNVRYPNAKYMIPFAQLALDNNTSISVDDIEPVYVRDTVTWKKLPHKM